jgi:hypothetical protein
VLNLCDQIRTSICIAQLSLLVHDVIILWRADLRVLWEMSRPTAASTSFISNILVRSRAPSAALILIKRDLSHLTNSPDPAKAVQGRPTPLASNKAVIARLTSLTAFILDDCWRKNNLQPNVNLGLREGEFINPLIYIPLLILAVQFGFSFDWFRPQLILTRYDLG